MVSIAARNKSDKRKRFDGIPNLASLSGEEGTAAIGGGVKQELQHGDVEDHHVPDANASGEGTERDRNTANSPAQEPVGVEPFMGFRARRRKLRDNTAGDSATISAFLQG